LEYRCSTQRWKSEARNAVAACEKEYLPLEYARKMPPD
jgi:hypothetical protein